MTNYSKTTNFTAKDSLVSGDANKIVKGSEIDAEFDNIATASATKANIASPVFTGVVSFPDGSAGDPSITNTGDTNTGLFFSAADTLSFTAAGTAQFTMGDGVIAPVTDADVDLGTSSLEFKDAYFDGTVHTDAINLNGTAITSTAAELNILDGVTSTAAELNILDGVTATAAELNILDGVTSTAAELNILDGKAFLDEDDMSSNSATGIASQQSIKAYVDSQVTAQDLDFQADSGGALSIDLDSETLTFTGGTGIDTSGSGNAVTFAIDSTVATLTGTQTLTNKTLTSPDINTPDIDGGTIDNTVIGGSTPAAGTFTTFTSNGIDDNASSTTVTIDSNNRMAIGGTVVTDVNLLNIQGSGSSSNIGVVLNDTSTSKIYSIQNGGSALKFFDYTASTEIMRISGGNVGIGESNPLDSLSISSSAGNAAIRLKRTDTTIANDDIYGAINFAGDDSDTNASGIRGFIRGRAQGTGGGMKMEFHTAGGGAALVSEPRMTLNADGNLGIGTSSAGTFRTKIKHSAASVTTGLGIEASANDSVLRIFHSGSLAGFNATYSSTGAYVPMVFNVGAGGEAMRIGSSGELQIGGTTNAGFVDFDGTNLQLNTQRNPNTGAFVNTGKAHAGITLSSASADSHIKFYTTNANNSAASERMRIDSSGKVGIGTSSPSAEVPLTAVYSTTSQFHLGGPQAGISNNTYYNGSAWVNRTSSLGGAVLQMSTSGEFNFRRAGTGANPTLSYSMTIDSSGNVLVGKTTTALATAGLTFGAAGFASLTRSGAEPLNVNRLSSDGSLAVFYKDGAEQGNIGCQFDDLNINGAGNQAGIRFQETSLMPRKNQADADNSISLGLSSHRFTAVYAVNGTIQTSDRNEKQDIEELSDAEQRVAVAAKGLLRKYRWKSAVEEKGDDARIHFGIIAQDLQDAFTAEGLDAARYGMFCSDTWTDEETGEERTRLGVRYSELLAFIISAI